MQQSHNCKVSVDSEQQSNPCRISKTIVRLPQRRFTCDTISCRQAMMFKKKQSAVDEQIAEIDKLNAVINAAERDMLKLRKVCGSSLLQQLQHQ